VAEKFDQRVVKLQLPGRLMSEVAWLLATILGLNKQIIQLDRIVEILVDQDKRVTILKSIPSVGPVTSAAFVAALDDKSRFKDGHQVQESIAVVALARKLAGTMYAMLRDRTEYRSKTNQEYKLAV
jgi:transposase